MRIAIDITIIKWWTKTVWIIHLWSLLSGPSLIFTFAQPILLHEVHTFLFYRYERFADLNSIVESIFM